MQRNAYRKRRKALKSYPVTQCALYKLSSLKKLSDLLNLPKESIKSLIGSSEKYREFELPEETDPFSLRRRKARWVQEPTPQLKQVHERILYLLEPVFVPEYAHAAKRGRSYRTNANCHRSSPSIATFDLRDFYGSTRRNIVFDFFRDQLMCASDIAGILAELTTYKNKIPTGSPLSPLLSLHVARPMLDLMESVAKDHNLIFTCYVDDLTFSGKTIPLSLERKITKIANMYGYDISHKKTKIFLPHQAKHVTGVVIIDEQLRVPFTRFRTARNLQAAVIDPSKRHGLSELKLKEKLAGLLGEAAYLDPSYRGMADTAYESLKAAKAETETN